MGWVSEKIKYWLSNNFDNWTRTSPLLLWFGSDNNTEVWITIDGKELHLFKTTAELNITISRFGQMLANGRYVHKRENGTEQGEEIQRSPIVQLLDKPNPMQTKEEFITESVIYYFIYGNQPLYPTSKNTLINLNPKYVKIKVTNNTIDVSDIDEVIEKIVYEDSKTKEKLSLLGSDVFMLKRVDPDSKIKGESILTALQMPITNIRGSYGFRNVNINKRGALGFISNASKDEVGKLAVSPEDRKELAKQYSEQYGIKSGQAPVAISDSELKWNHTAYPIGQMMLFEEVSEDFKRIIDMVGLNDNIFSKEKSKVQANLNEGLKMAYQDAIIPFSQSFCSNLTKALKLPDNEWLELDFSHLPVFKENEQEKAKTEQIKADALDKLVKAGMLLDDAKLIVYG